MWVRFPPPALGFGRFSTSALTTLDKIWTNLPGAGRDKEGMRPAPNVVTGILLMQVTGGCSDRRGVRDNQIEPEVWSVVTFTVPGEEPILLPEEGLIGLDLVRITTLGGRQILLSHARVSGESIQLSEAVAGQCYPRTEDLG